MLILTVALVQMLVQMLMQARVVDFAQNYVKGHDIFSSKSCVHLGVDFVPFYDLPMF